MSVTSYYATIVNALHGKGEGIEVPPERADWSGPGLVLELYDTATSADDRAEFVEAMRKILAESEEPAEVLAELVQLASVLDLVQLEPTIVGLRTSSRRSDPLLSRAIDNYVAYRRVHQRAGGCNYLI